MEKNTTSYNFEKELNFSSDYPTDTTTMKTLT